MEGPAPVGLKPAGLDECRLDWSKRRKGRGYLAGLSLQTARGGVIVMRWTRALPWFCPSDMERNELMDWERIGWPQSFDHDHEILSLYYV